MSLTTIGACDPPTRPFLIVGRSPYSNMGLGATGSAACLMDIRRAFPIVESMTSICVQHADTVIVFSRLTTTRVCPFIAVVVAIIWP